MRATSIPSFEHFSLVVCGGGRVWGGCCDWLAHDAMDAAARPFGLVSAGDGMLVNIFDCARWPGR